MFPQEDMPDLRILPATSYIAVERGYDRASQAGIYFTMTLLWIGELMVMIKICVFQLRKV